MNFVEALRRVKAHSGHFHCFNFKTGLSDHCEYVANIVVSYRVGFNNGKCKVAQLILLEFIFYDLTFFL